MMRFRKLMVMAGLTAMAYLSARADNLVIFTLSITNTPTNLASITINSATRTWVTTVTNPATQILITNDNGALATNLFNQLAGNPIGGLGSLNHFGTNGITGQGINLTESVTTNWCTNTLTTNALGGAYGVMVPINAAYPVASDQMNTANYLVQGIDSFATALFGASSPSLANYLGLSTVQTVTGAKTFANFSGTAGSITNASLLNPTMTNGQNFGNPFRSPGPQTGSEQFGIGAAATNTFGVAFGDGATASGSEAVAIGFAPTAAGLGSVGIGAFAHAGGIFDVAVGDSAFALADDGVNGSTAVGTGANANKAGSTAIGNNASAAGLGSGTNAVSVGIFTSALGNGATALGAFATATPVNSTAIGQHSAATTTNQVMLGVASGSVAIPGVLNAAGGVSNLVELGTITSIGGQTSDGTNILGGIVCYSGTNNSSLANGNNAGVLVGTNVYLNVSGPSGAFTINGIVPAGIDRQEITIENATGQSMTLANESGVDSTAANRIKTGFNADQVYTNNPAEVTLVYRTGISRWIVKGHN